MFSENLNLPIFSEADEIFMKRAIELGKKASEENEVPVGAVLVLENKIIGEGYNQSIKLNDPSAHAEIIAIRKGALHCNNYRLNHTTLYVTLEPCMMCAGAMIHSRIKKVVFGTHDPKTGCVQSVAKMLDHEFLNHRINYAGGLLANECKHLLNEFFKVRR